MSLNLRKLHSFVIVAEEGNLTRAAARLNVSQPTLSRRIRDLEQGVGFRLFEQVGRGIRITGQGETFLGHCRDLVARADTLEEYLEVFASGDVGVLRIGASAPVLDFLFPRLLLRYCERFPKVEIKLVENGSIDLLHQLEHGEVHLAVTSFPTSARFDARVLGTVPILAAMSRSRAPGGSGLIDVKDLVAVPLLQLRPGFYTRDTFDAACRLAHVKPRIVLESGAPQTLIAMAEADLGIAVVPSTVRIEHYDVCVRPIAHKGRPLEKRLSIAWVRDRLLPPYANGFVTEIGTCVHELFSEMSLHLTELET